MGEAVARQVRVVLRATMVPRGGRRLPPAMRHHDNFIPVKGLLARRRGVSADVAQPVLRFGNVRAVAALPKRNTSGPYRTQEQREGHRAERVLGEMIGLVA